MSEMQLNGPEIYKFFTGRNVDQMPLLIHEDRIPVSIAGVMERRVHAYPSKIRETWLNINVKTGDGIAYHPDGYVKLVRDTLRDINPRSRLIDGAFALEDGQYESLHGLELSRAEVKKYVSYYPMEGSVVGFSKNEVKSNPLWRFYSRDLNLLKEYTDLIFPPRARFEYDKKMRIRITRQESISKKIPTMRLLYIRGNDTLSRSDIEGTLDLDNPYHVLIGATPEAYIPEVKRTSIDTIISSALKRMNVPFFK